MPVKFFGQFLIDQGEVDASDVREALELMEETNPTIGELAVCAGFITGRQATEVSAAQRSRDLCFGELAVELGLLAPAQLAEVVERQRSQRLAIGEALVHLSHLPADRLSTLLDAYKADQARYEVGALALPEPLGAHPAAPRVLELLPRFLKRVARIEAKVGDVAAFEGSPAQADVQVSVRITGPRGLDVALVSDRVFAEELAMATSGLGRADLDPEMVADGVGEFLNVLGGNAVSAATQAGHRVALGPPDYEASVRDGWRVDLAVGVGTAFLVLRVS